MLDELRLIFSSDVALMHGISQSGLHTAHGKVPVKIPTKE
jgi:hypothetical protein